MLPLQRFSAFLVRHSLGRRGNASNDSRAEASIVMLSTVEGSPFLVGRTAGRAIVNAGIHFTILRPARRPSLGLVILLRYFLDLCVVKR